MDKKELKVLYKKSVSAKIIALCLSLSVAIILFFVDLSVGASGMSFFDMVRALFGGGTLQQYCRNAFNGHFATSDDYRYDFHDKLGVCAD